MKTWYVHYQNSVEEVTAESAQDACVAVAKNIDPMVAGWPLIFIATNSADPKSVDEDDAIPMRAPLALRMAERISEEEEAQFDAAILQYIESKE
jgi:hypothetical protein